MALISYNELMITIENIKKYISEILLLVGSPLFVYNIFNFSSRGYYNTLSGFSNLKVGDLGASSDQIIGNYYYYSNYTLLMIAIGITLIVLAILIMVNKKNG